MREHIAISLLLVSALVAMSVRAEGQVYRWVDEKGTVNYSSTRPGYQIGTSIKAVPAMRFSIPCSTAECFNAEASQAQWAYQRNSAALSAYAQSLRYQDEQAAWSEAAEAEAASQHDWRRARLRRTCDRLRMVDCTDELTLKRLEDMDRPGTVLRRSRAR